MFEKNTVEKYIEYTKALGKKLDEYFNDQQEFLACKIGCDLCCRSSYYPCSALEYEYVRMGINELNEEEKQKIYDTSINIFKDRKDFLKTNSNVMKYVYSCLFLVDGICKIYPYRPFVCKTHGLIYKDTENENKNNAPFCMKLGLNYAEIYNEETGRFSIEKASNPKFKNKPQIYNLSYSVLMQDSGIEDFGDVRMIFEWLVMDIPNYEELIKD